MGVYGLPYFITHMVTWSYIIHHKINHINHKVRHKDQVKQADGLGLLVVILIFLLQFVGVCTH